MALSEERRQEIKYLYDQGASIEEIAKNLKMTESTVTKQVDGYEGEWMRKFREEWDEVRIKLRRAYGYDD